MRQSHKETQVNEPITATITTATTTTTTTTKMTSSRPNADRPLRCICNLCECGGHKCADFNEWPSGRGRGSSSLASDTEFELSESNNQQANLHRHHQAWACNYSNMTDNNMLEERYLTKVASGSRSPSEGLKKDQELTSASTGAEAAHQTDDKNDSKKQQRQQSRSKRQIADAAEDRDSKQEQPLRPDEELLHVLVTRPQVASKPRDHIIFEGDMDLRTTFETSYEALARLRLDQWKRHQEDKSRQKSNGVEVSDRVEHQAGRSGGCGGGAPSRLSERRTRRGAHDENDDAADEAEVGAQTPDDVDGGRARDRGTNLNYKRAQTSMSEVRKSAPLDESGQVPKTRTNAKMIRSPTRFRGGDSSGHRAGSQQQQQQPPVELTDGAAGIGKGPASGAPSTAVAAGRTTSSLAQTSRRQQQQQQQQQQQPPATTEREQFIDPDLSPIIVYDANLNRLERVGLRKRSKYRPSTSLRPGGRSGFFGGGDGGSVVEPPDSKKEEDDAKRTENRMNTRHKRDANEMKCEKESNNLDDSSPYLFSPEPSPARVSRLHDKAAGASSKQLNRDKNAVGESGGRKHNLANVNRIDHIKQFNLVANTDPNFKEFRDKSTLTDLVKFQTELNNGSSDLKASNDNIDDQAAGRAEEESERERRLAREEEAAAVAEIQRLVTGGEDEPQTQLASPSRQSNSRTPLAKQNTIAASPSEQLTNKRRELNSRASNATGKSSRQSHQERVCQNQSFYLYENSYPEASSGLLDDQFCKIGGHQTAASGGSQQQLAGPSPQALRMDRNKNLFRESPDFILTTGHGRKEDHWRRQSNIVDQGQQQSRAVEEGNLKGRPAFSSQEHDGIAINLDNLRDQEGHASESCHKCRVFDLGNEFEFVGSKSGHKYFVERIHDTPMADIN